MAVQRKALVVGIDYYENIDVLFGCSRDARSVEEVLERHGDEEGTKNFHVDSIVVTDAKTSIKRGELKDRVTELFADDYEIALFYFAGHGYVEATGGYILTSEADRGDDGLSLAEVLTIANKSRAKSKIIVLDSCHSGIAGTPPEAGNQAVLSEGLTILTASTKDQYASETKGSGVFTRLFVNALSGAASNLVGDVSPGAVYAHIDQSLGPWSQRPVFKTNVKTFVSLRRVRPPIPLPELRAITKLFPKPGYLFPLDPSFEPEKKGRSPGMPEPNPANTVTFATLQRYNRVNLVVPVDAPHMWHAAMESKSCKLTILGEHYWRLVREKLI